MAVMNGRSVMLVSANADLRHGLTEGLSRMRWRVRAESGGAAALESLEQQPAEVLLIDRWLPDLEVGEFVHQVRSLFDGVEVLYLDGEVVGGSRAGPQRGELLHLLREVDAAANRRPPELVPEEAKTENTVAWAAAAPAGKPPPAIEGMVGSSAVMQEMAQMIRMVAPRATTVLIEGETGTGKELVAKAVHRWSTRSGKPFAVLNCAAIPEALLEAELFGHTRGAFTGAVQSRTGRIEAADGGTLFLDEIGEMPLPLQAKMLRFLESGELQRVGDNDLVRVDVRVVAATHQNLHRRVHEGTFRIDLYHRLAVFVIDVPPLRERREDIAALAENFLAELGKSSPRKRMSAEFLAGLVAFDWPGNVRELAHVLERAVILSGDGTTLQTQHLRLRSLPRE